MFVGTMGPRLLPLAQSVPRVQRAQTQAGVDGARFHGRCGHRWSAQRPRRMGPFEAVDDLQLTRLQQPAPGGSAARGARASGASRVTRRSQAPGSCFYQDTQDPKTLDHFHQSGLIISNAQAIISKTK